MKLGRSRCDRTVEHRLTFGQFERKKIDEILAQQERNIWLDAIPSVGIGALGIGAVLAGYALLRWAGVTIQNLIDDTADFVNKASTKMADRIWTPAEKRIEEIRLRILEIRERMNQINALLSEGPPFAARVELINEGQRLSEEETLLMAELNDYTTGKTDFARGVYPE